MSAQAIIRRYKRIIDILESGQYPSLEDIIEYIERVGLKTSKRTIERDFEAIRNDFDIEIEYNRTKRGYFINQEKSLPIDNFLRLLELVETAHILQESLKESKETLSYIDFEYERIESGIEHLQNTLQAIRNLQLIRFDHESYQTGKTKSYTVKPYLIKEYQGRWYVVGEVKGRKEFRTFGMDRINKLEVLADTFTPKENVNVKERFQDVVGLTYSVSEMQKVVLAVKNKQVPYLKSVPLHASQRIVEEKDGETIIELYLKPNFEFIQRIFMQMDMARVIEPEEIKNEIRVRLNRMKNMY